MNRCPHDKPFTWASHSDAAKNARDNINLHYASVGWDAVGKFVAIALQDGSSDHNLYDTKRDAVRHQSNEFLFMYVKIVPSQITECEAQILLDFHRKAYENGFRLADPDSRNGGRNLIVRGRPVETVTEQLSRLIRKG